MPSKNLGIALNMTHDVALSALFSEPFAIITILASDDARGRCELPGTDSIFQLQWRAPDRIPMWQRQNVVAVFITLCNLHAAALELRTHAFDETGGGNLILYEESWRWNEDLADVVNATKDTVGGAARLAQIHAGILGEAVSQGVMGSAAKLRDGDFHGALEAARGALTQAKVESDKATRSFRSSVPRLLAVILLVIGIGLLWGIEHLLSPRTDQDSLGSAILGSPSESQKVGEFYHFPALGTLRFLLSIMVLLFNFYPWTIQEVQSLGWAEPNLRGESSAQRDLQKCGVLGGRSLGFQNRIMHGRSADKCTWRWQVSLHDRRRNSTESHFCGGTLIDRKWVLTAAHCVGSYSKCDRGFLHVVAGEWNHALKAPDSITQRNVTRIIKHPRYSSEAPSDYDFALLELDKPMPINECIGLACLPSEEDTPGQGCSITGWGAAATGPRPSVLQEASVTTLTNELCTQKYAEQNSSITASMLCASGLSESGITDACHGDSGGPMVCAEKGFFVVRGVTSWGLGCASRYPGVYARVYRALDWIYKTMASSEELPKIDFHGQMWSVTKGLDICATLTDGDVALEVCAKPRT
eukprot:s643_g16.t1